MMGEHPSHKVAANGQGEAALLPAILNAMDQGFALFEVVYDELGQPADFRHLDLNPIGERLMGLSREQVVGKTMLELFPDVEPFWRDTFARVALIGEPARYQSYNHNVGKWFDVHTFRPSEGLVASLYSDITDLRELQERQSRLLLDLEAQTIDLALERDRLRIVLDSIADAVFVCDARGVLTLANPTGLALLGADRVEDVQMLAGCLSALSLASPDGQPMPASCLCIARALLGETTFERHEVAAHPRTGRRLDLLVTAAPLLSADGTIVGAVETAKDVTDLMELDRVKEQFIAVAAHELRTPVTIVKGYSQVLLRMVSDLSPACLRMLQGVDRGADRIERIVRDLLDVSELQLGRFEMEKEPIDLAELAEQVADQVAVSSGRDITATHAERAPVVGDRRRLSQVLTNLLDNAVKYSPEGPYPSPESREIAVRVTVRGGEAVVSVTDRGIGIPLEKQRRIFERFYRAHAGTQYEYGGVGINLYISREIVVRHGGRIWFESEEGKGSTFSFSLPAER